MQAVTVVSDGQYSCNWINQSQTYESLLIRWKAACRRHQYQAASPWLLLKSMLHCPPWNATCFDNFAIIMSTWRIAFKEKPHSLTDCLNILCQNFHKIIASIIYRNSSFLFLYHTKGHFKQLLKKQRIDDWAYCICIW